ncbi:gamma-glutamyl-gamma-aminobutyrate hydrolase family protein [Microbacterium indicum]|uniref:gamma-glutamyl-gamma-aminobutyrate hydrolase family protein n=1 Tax=Microbacterium indicum TaxID=358100 RepID=UPI0003F7C521|nr:gamma-glutamyl-gamma-aminobutyrate hydrolase family protein [Microbacterium indicum]
MSEPLVAVVHVRDARPAAPWYQQLVDRFNRSALATIASLGWRSELVPAGEIGPDASVKAARAADLVLIMGGEDVHPSFYRGAAEYPGSGAHDVAGDEAQIAVVADAALRGAPLLGICRGHQILNVALGGDLVQHLPTTHAHRGVGEKRFLEHDLHAIDPALAGAVLAGEPVQSSHHQAVGRLGAGLRAGARGEDGVVEAVVHDAAPIVGVQWHPEHEAARPGQLARLLRLVEARAA